MTLKEPHEMIENKIIPQALHIFWDIAPHLSLPIMKKIKEFFPMHKFALYKTSRNLEVFKEKNKEFSQYAAMQYHGEINQSWMKKIFVKVPIINVFNQKLGVEVSFLSFIKLLLGPKHIILHGRNSAQFNLFTLLSLKLFQRRIYLIHWGGKPHQGRIFGLIDRLAYRQFSHIFVLMTPEIDYFKSFMGNRVSCLPYNMTLQPFKPLKIPHFQSSKKILLGNSAHQQSDYREILNRLIPGEWDKITCMLNYGDETTQDKTDAFVKEYQTKFGSVFYPWRVTLPLEEYRKVLAESAFYVCIAKTQTGLGAIYNSICQGKTLILRGDNYKWIRRLGVKAYDYDELSDLSFEALQKMKTTTEEAQENLEHYYRNFLLKYTPDLWKAEMLRVMTSN